MPSRIKKNNNMDAKEKAEAIKKTSSRASQRAKTPPAKRKTKDIVELIQQDGKAHNKRGVKTLYELLGESSGSPYTTTDVREYEAMLNGMNTSDLQRHATTVQVLPKEDRRLLIKLLVKQFQSANSRALNTAEQIPMGQKPLTQEVIDILAEGR